MKVYAEVPLGEAGRVWVRRVTPEAHFANPAHLTDADRAAPRTANTGCSEFIFKVRRGETVMEPVKRFREEHLTEAEVYALTTP